MSRRAYYCAIMSIMHVYKYEDASAYSMFDRYPLSVTKTRNFMTKPETASKNYVLRQRSRNADVNRRL